MKVSNTVKSAVGTMLAASLLLFGSMSTATAAPLEETTTTTADVSGQGIQAYSPTPGVGVVITDEGTFSASYSEDRSTVTLTAPGNSTLTINASEIDALSNQLVPDSRESVTVYGPNTFTCSAALLVVGWIHNWGWATAAALALASGAVGAAVVAFVMAYGVDALFMWAGRYC